MAIDVRVESLLMRPNSTAAPTHETTAVSDSRPDDLSPKPRWRRREARRDE